MKEELLIMSFIFFARIFDVSLGTLRIVLIARGHKYIAPLIGFFEILIWLTAISTALQNLQGVWSYIIYAAGFATGNYIGMLLEEKLKIGFQSIRIITQRKVTDLPKILRKNGIGVTEITGKGRDREVSIVFTVVSRKQVQTVLSLVKEHHPKAFITIEDVKSYQEGFISQRSFLGQFGRFVPKRK